MQEIKEEDARSDKYRNKLEVSLTTRENKSGKEERNSNNILRQIRHMFERKQNTGKENEIDSEPNQKHQLEIQ